LIFLRRLTESSQCLPPPRHQEDIRGAHLWREFHQFLDSALLPLKVVSSKNPHAFFACFLLTMGSDHYILSPRLLITRCARGSPSTHTKYHFHPPPPHPTNPCLVVSSHTLVLVEVVYSTSTYCPPFIRIAPLPAFRPFHSPPVQLSSIVFTSPFNPCCAGPSGSLKGKVLSSGSNIDDRGALPICTFSPLSLHIPDRDLRPLTLPFSSFLLRPVNLHVLAYSFILSPSFLGFPH